MEEAERIIFERFEPAGRPADAHDVRATFEIVSDPDQMRQVPESADHLIRLLKDRHARLMSARLDKIPGEFKRRENHAGSTLFVAPDEVEGTLREAWRRGASLTDAFSRAAFLGFVVAEVHPFDDGNGRMSRLMMNAELVAQDQCRVLVPNIYRNDYLSGLTSLSANGHPTAYIDIIAFAQRFTREVDFSDLGRSERILRATNALRDPQDALRYQLRLPSTLDINAILLDKA